MKKIKDKILYLGLSIKKELLIFCIANFSILLASALIAILTKKWQILGFGAGFAVLFSILFVTRYDSKIAKSKSNNLVEFSELFGFFRIYIRNGYSVYSALKEITNFANPELNKMLSNLIKEIDEDKTIQPFINFARNFDEIIIEEIMISIYQMIDEGEQSNYLNQFEFIFDKFSDLLSERNLKKKDSLLGTISSAPLVGSCFLIIVITIGIIGIIGEVTNGI